MACSVRFALLFLMLACWQSARGDSPNGKDTDRPPPPVNYARDVRPILSDNCFACHGPDNHKRKGGLRFDTKDGAFTKLESGNTAIVPGKPDDSELVDRINSEDPDLRMPPAKSGKQLTASQVAVLRRWVEQGAKTSSHWAFEPPAKPAGPLVRNESWPRNTIDRFILARLEAEELSPAAEATKATLIRRVTLDLTGLPPTLEQLDAFLADRSPEAYEKVVDGLLESPRYGEHMARFWLDAARYGDTHGLHLDNYREIWPYREWVINAFNANKGFDTFIVEQLAGDLLVNPTPDQLIATGFNRCHVSTSEGGSIEEEVYVRNVVDQVDTNGTVFLGLTTGCARCHDHKYDPIRTKDYYQLFAFFNNIDGSPMDGNGAKWAPIASVPTRKQAEEQRALALETARLEQTRRETIGRMVSDSVKLKDESDGKPAATKTEFVWIDDALPAGATLQGEGEFVEKPKSPVFSGRAALRITARGVTQRFFDNSPRKLRVGAGDRLFAHVYMASNRPAKELMLQWHTNGNWTHRAYWGGNQVDFGKDGSPERTRLGDLPTSGKWVRLEVPVEKLKLAPGTEIDGWAFTQFDGTVYWDRAGIETRTPQDGQLYDSLSAWINSVRGGASGGVPEAIKKIAAIEKSKRSEPQSKELVSYFFEHACSRTAKLLEPIDAKIEHVQRRRKELEEQLPTTLVFREKAGEPKPAFLLKRGEYDQRGEKGRARRARVPAAASAWRSG